MISWGDKTPEPVREDLDALGEASVEAARRMLEENGEVVPFGVLMTVEGETRIVPGEADPVEPHQSQAATDVLYARIAADRDSLRAAAVVADVCMDGSTAIRVRGEHRDGGPAMEILVRYTRKRSRGGISLGVSSVARTDRQIWMLTETDQASDAHGVRPQIGGSSTPSGSSIVALVLLVPLSLVVALGMLWAGTFAGTGSEAFGVPADQLRIGRLLVIGAGLCASAPFAVTAWKIRRDRSGAFLVFVIITSLIMLASLGVALSMPWTSDNAGF